MGLSVALVYGTTFRACPAGVARFDGDHGDACKQRLVAHELAKLIEGPSRKTVALRLSNLRPLADMRQIFQRNRRTGAFGDGNNLLGNHMVGVLAKAGLLPAELLEAPLGGLGAALLESGATAV